MILTGPYLAGCVLLVAAGILKTARPADTARALAALLPARAPLPLGFLASAVRILAALEAALGGAALVLPRPALAGAVAGSYAAFTLVVVHARLRGGPLASCGCFGTPDTPATWLHAAVDLVVAVAAATVAVAVAADPAHARVLGELAGQPLHGAPLLASALVGAGAAYLAMGPAARLGTAAAAVRVTGTAHAHDAHDHHAHDARHQHVASPPVVPLPDPARRGVTGVVR